MRFSPTEIAGVVLVDSDPVLDDRGAFARLHCPDEFAQAGIDFSPAQTSLSRNTAAFTLRGMHYQPAPHGRALFIPEGVAHGFLTLEPHTDVLYQIAPMFEPGHGAGVRWNDPAFAIAWPTPPQVISERDASYPDFDPEAGPGGR